jgi:uncharacterized protein YeaO (DUF488 family)
MVLRFHPVGSRSIKVARVYDDPGPDDGERVLVDRLWPRGFRKGDPRVGQWIPKVAPSTKLRNWYSHQTERFAEFAARYADELDSDDGGKTWCAILGLNQTLFRVVQDS